MLFLKPIAIKIAIAGSTLVATGLGLDYQNASTEASTQSIATETMKTSATIEPHTALPLTETSRTYDEQIKGNQRSMTMTCVNNDTAFPWRMHWGDRIDHVGMTEDGTIVIGRTEDLGHDAISIFAPPLPLISAMKAGEQTTAKSSMVVYDRNDRTKVRDRGTCTVTINYESQQQIHTEGGDFEAFRIKRIFQANLGIARVDSTTTQWVAPHEGIVAETNSETVSALFPLWTVDQNLVLAN